MMFKILVIQAANGLSDERTEFLINDRLSFMRFLGWGWPTGFLTPARSGCSARSSPGPGRSSGCSSASTRRCARPGYIAMCGQIVDATFAVAAPKQRNTDDEKRAIKEGRIPEDWKANPGKLRQKDRDARWTVKFSKAKERPDGTATRGHRHSDLRLPEPHLHRPRLGLIRAGMATDAAAYEGARLREGLLDKSNTASAVWADTAYRSKANEDFLEKNGFVSRIHRKKPPGRPMPKRTRRANAEKSKVRSCIEHVFAEQKARMGLFIRTVGIARATTKIGMANLVYNFRRPVYLDRIAAA